MPVCANVNELFSSAAFLFGFYFLSFVLFLLRFFLHQKTIYIGRDMGGSKDEVDGIIGDVGIGNIMGSVVLDNHL